MSGGSIDAVTSLFAELAGLLLPVVCAGCGHPDEPWCADCATYLERPPARCEERAGRLDLLDGRAPPPVWCAAPLAGPLRPAVTAWKDRGRTDLGPVFSAAVRGLMRDPVVRVQLAGLALGGELAVVGVPTSGAARRRRGWDPVAVLVAAVCGGLEAAGLGGRVLPALGRRSGEDLARVGSRERAARANATVRVRRRAAGNLVGARVVLVDDVLTTGATFAACRAALLGAGAQVLAGVVLASTPAPGETPGAGSPARRVDGSRSGR